MEKLTRPSKNLQHRDSGTSGIYRDGAHWKHNWDSIQSKQFKDILSARQLKQTQNYGQVTWTGKSFNTEAYLAVLTTITINVLVLPFTKQEQSEVYQVSSQGISVDQ